MITIPKAACFSLLLIFLFVCTSSGQSRHNSRGNETDGAVLTVTSSHGDKKGDPIKIENLNLYENGIEQKIKNFSFDPSPSKIVILVDNSQTLATPTDEM